MSTVPSLTDEELIEEIMNGSNGDDEKEGDWDTVFSLACSKANHFQNALQKLQDYMHSRQDSEEIIYTIYIQFIYNLQALS